MKTISDFFENNDFTYLEITNELEEEYKKIWEEIYKPSQDKKIKENNIEDEFKQKAFNGLSKRGKFLCQIYDYFNCKNVAEVGTAEGFQFYTFCHHLQKKEIKHKVYSCDIRDVRNKKYVQKFGDIENFLLGTSKEMSEKIISDNQKIDLFWIDGAHHNSAVLRDVIRLAKTQSNNSVWVFDDYNEHDNIINDNNTIINKLLHNTSFGLTGNILKKLIKKFLNYLG